MPQLYESLFILRPSLADEDIPKMLDKVKATVEKAGGTVEHLSNWGKRKLAYEIKQEKKGIYVQLNYRSEEHTSELQSQSNLVCRLLLEKKKKNNNATMA